MTTATRFIMIGGFLGAGKTTTISRLARQFEVEGKRVAIVTNDQAPNLVDTLLLRSQGYYVGEVTGSCFCCNFNALIKAVESLSAAERPDVVLAEPVGSCTDLVATVVRPLEQKYEQPFDIAPYGVIVKPNHALQMLESKKQARFSPNAQYIFRKQIEEADFVILNRIDELSSAEIDKLSEFLVKRYGDIPVVRMSAKTGEGFDVLNKYLDRNGVTGGRVMDVDYDIYAEGEAELGWLNCRSRITSTKPLDLDECLMHILRRIHAVTVDIDAEVAHLKLIGIVDGGYAVGNLVSNSQKPVLSLPSHWIGHCAEIVVNARVALAPDQLESLVYSSIQNCTQDRGASVQMVSLQCFRPGRPVPTYRLAT